MAELMCSIGEPAMIMGAVLQGISAIIIDIEIAVGRGDSFQIVGLGRTEVREGRERLRNAIQESGFDWPTEAITVNLAPADIVKEGTTLDLPIALALLLKTRQITNALGESVYAVGELGLEGTVRQCRGALGIGQAVGNGSPLIAPYGNRYELGLLQQIKGAKKEFKPYIVRSLKEAVDTLSGKVERLPRISQEELRPAFHSGIDFQQIKGQARAKRAFEVAAAGGHNVLLSGPPGEGKSMLAKALPTILPRLSPAEIVELTGIYSAKGELPSEDSIVTYRPFRSVHHSANAVAIVGGGHGYPMPGEITLGHRGVLFMDELPEFGPHLLQSLRQPLEDGKVHLARAGGAATYPSEIILVAAMNPCPCGFEGEYICARCNHRLPHGEKVCPKCNETHPLHSCKCTTAEIERYQRRISGPVMDRIDLIIRLGALSAEERFGTADGESSAAIRKRVEAARQIQLRRYDGTSIMVNARIPGGQVDRFCQLQQSAMDAMKEAAEKIPELTTRGHDKLLKVSRTIADLNGSALITRKHIEDAANLCGHDRVRRLLESRRA